MNFLEQTPAFIQGLSFILLYIIVFFLAKWIKNLFISFQLDEELTEKDNHAVSISVSGYFIGVTLVFIGALSGPSYDFVQDILLVSAYSIAGVLLLNLTRVVADKLVLPKFSIKKELIQDQNAGTGVVEGATYVASGLIIAGAIHGEGGGPVSALAFYGIGLVSQILFSKIYDWTSPYDVHDEIEQDNIAAGMGFAGGLIAIGIIVMKAISGNFTGWVEDLTTVGLDLLLVFGYLIGVRFIFDRYILRNTNLQSEIVRDRNLGAGLLEMTVAICFAVVLAYLI